MPVLFYLGTIIFTVVVSTLGDQDATRLRARPFLHCTSIVILAILMVMLAARLTGQLQLYHLTLMASVAVTSHHLRDSLRRGLWLWPYGSTPPVKIGFYYAGLGCIILVASLGIRTSLQKEEPNVSLV
uniref:Transmembrane protein 267 n=1 Tax=Ixodes ricinus TaxID=34613 RepID=A0A6B0UQ96_IXORI